VCGNAHRTLSKGRINRTKTIQLVCAYDYIKDGSVLLDARTAFGTYLVRILSSGMRMAVDMQRHTWNYASSSLIYDISFNVAYLSSYNTTSYAGQKQVFKIQFSPDYNFLSETSSTAPRSAIASALVRAHYDMQPPYSAGTPSSTYPSGISFDYAVMEARLSALFFYMFTTPGQNVFVNR
jgi:hypothetical protein